jgi:tellurite resistance protein
MSVANAVNAIAAWASSSGISAGDRDLSPFLTGALLVATADGPLDAGERQQIEKISGAIVGKELTGESLTSELDWLATNGVEGAIKTIGENITSPTERGLLVTIAALVATAEQGVNAKEGAMLQKLGQGIGFSQNQVLEFLGKAMKAAGGSWLEP